MVSVVSAEMGDIDAIIEIGKRGHAASANADYEIDEQRMKLLCATLIAGKRTCLFVAKRAGAVVGVLLGQEDIFGYCKLRYATDIALYAEVPGAGRKLMQRFERWAFDERKVDQVVMGVMHGGKSARHTEALYGRAGFTYVGGLYVKRRPA